MISTVRRQDYEYASRRLRTNQALVALITSVTPGAIAAAAVPGTWRLFLILGTAVTACWAFLRGFRLILQASADRVLIRNYWRSFEFRWGEVTDVGVGAERMGVLPQPAFAFRLTDGRTIRAQATPFKVRDQMAQMEELARIAPPSVQFHWPQARPG